MKAADELKQLADDTEGRDTVEAFPRQAFVNIDDRIIRFGFRGAQGDIPAQKITRYSDFPEYNIVVEGHTDNVPIRPASSGQLLSTEGASRC